MPVIQRINKVVDWLKLEGFIESRRDLASKLGYTESSLSQILNGKVSISDRFIKKLLNMSNLLNKEWLNSGEGEMLRSGNSSIDKSFPSKINDLIQETKPGIPLYRTEAAAGFGTSDFAVEEKDIEARYKIRELESASFMLHVRGDSMTPNYNNGDIVALKKVIDNRSIQWGKPHLISSRVHGLLLKRIYEDDGHIIAVSDNASYKPIIINKKDIEGVAMVMGCIKLENYQ